MVKCRDVHFPGFLIKSCFSLTETCFDKYRFVAATFLPIVRASLISSSLSSYHKKAAEALCVGRIQTRLGVAFFVSKLSGGIFF